MSRFRASRVQRLSAFQQIVYSGCWEDTETELTALALPEKARVLSITASGSRSLGLLEANPSEVISVDLNPAQNHLLELKRSSALGAESWDDHARFLGLLPASGKERLALYASVRLYMARNARAYWDDRSRIIMNGVIDAGRQDRLVSFFRTMASSLLPQRKLRPLFETDDLNEQIRYFDTHIDTKTARAIARLSTSKWALNWIYGKDLYKQSGFFSMGEMIFENLVRHAHARLLKENFILARVLLGKYLDPGRVNSYYLREASFDALRSRVSAVRPVTAPLEDVLSSLADASLDGFSFSDIFDWIAPRDFDRLMRETVRVAKDGARICYRICLVDRRPSAALASVIEEDVAMSKALHVLDRSCFYRDLFVGTIRKSARV